MNNNDVIRSLRQTLNLTPSDIASLFTLGNHQIEPERISDLLKEPGEAGFMACPDDYLSSFLDGLITQRRGKSDKKAEASPDNGRVLNNNLILKKLRIAFDLKEDDLLELLSLAEYETSRSEMGSIFRKPGNKHYRACGDEFLMGFLVGLSYREWN